MIGANDDVQDCAIHTQTGRIDLFHVANPHSLRPPGTKSPQECSLGSTPRITRVTSTAEARLYQSDPTRGHTHRRGRTLPVKMPRRRTPARAGVRTDPRPRVGEEARRVLARPARSSHFSWRKRRSGGTSYSMTHFAGRGTETSGPPTGPFSPRSLKWMGCSARQ